MYAPEVVGHSGHLRGDHDVKEVDFTSESFNETAEEDDLPGPLPNTYHSVIEI